MYKININSVHWARYIRFIDSRSNRAIPPDAIVEIHHIIPKCAGGNDTTNNLVKLTVREHFIAHWMLTNVGLGEVWYKLRFAFGFMGVSSKTNSYRKLLTSRQFEKSKKIRKETIKQWNDINPSKIKGTSWYADEEGTLYRCHSSSPKITEFNLTAISPGKGKKWYTDGTNFFMLVEFDPKIMSLKLYPGSPGLGKEKKYSSESAKRLSSDRAGRVWFNDGTRSYKLKPEDPRISELQLVSGRIISSTGLERIRKGAAWDRTSEHNLNNSSRQKAKLRYTDGVNNFTLLPDDPLISRLSLTRGVILTEEGKISLSSFSKGKDFSYIIGKKWFNDGIKNYRLLEKEGINLGLTIGKLHKIKSKDW
jgi:hypothetical protein